MVQRVDHAVKSVNLWWQSYTIFVHKNMMCTNQKWFSPPVCSISKKVQSRWTVFSHWSTVDMNASHFIVIALTCLNQFIGLGFVYTCGGYMILFLELFCKGPTLTSWIMSILLGMLCLAGMSSFYGVVCVQGNIIHLRAKCSVIFCKIKEL